MNVPVFHDYIAQIEDVIEAARNGKMFILVDAEDRENEGDLVIPAQMCTPDSVNFMAKYGRGLICLALTQERAKTLKIPMMTEVNGTPNQTAFTVSIEAKEGISTASPRTTARIRSPSPSTRPRARATSSRPATSSRSSRAMAARLCARGTRKPASISLGWQA